MMNLNLFQIVKNDSACSTLLGTNPTRFFLFGEAPDDVAKPYAVWQTISGVPENSLSCPPVIDLWSIQVDVYATSAKDVRAVAVALRNVLQQHGYVTSFNGEDRDTETKLYRLGFDLDFWTLR